MRARAIVLLAVASAALAAGAAPAAASKSQASVFMDDPKIVYAAPENLEPTLAEIRRLGADEIRVSVFWHLLAPNPQSRERPFPPGAGADPRNYAAEKWDRYDRIVVAARKVGLRVLFSPTSPAPHWATGTAPEPGHEDSYRPSPAEFKDFVKALGTRYSGQWRDEQPPPGDEPPSEGPCLPTPTIPLPPAVCPPDDGDPSPSNPNPANTGPLVPRVDRWSIWNEPNMPGWLTPQSGTHPRDQDRMLPLAPHVYRELADAMYAGLHETGHGDDTILLGETAPRGASREGLNHSIAPLRFIRELYCLDRRLRHFTGAEAEVRNCPAGGSGFAAAHPVLFNATGFAHHPYAFDAPPWRGDKNRDHVVMANIQRLPRMLDRVLARHGSSRKLPIWLTEYGYETDPPDPYMGWPWRAHVRFLAQAEWMGYRRARVRSVAQFLLYDDGPRLEYPASDPRHWGTFQTGLRMPDGKPKAAYAGYQRPIHLTRARVKRGRLTTVFARYRAAAARTPAVIQFRRKGRKGWRNVRKLRTNRHGFVARKLRVRRAGAFRVRFETGDGRVRTRAARVRVRR